MVAVYIVVLNKYCITFDRFLQLLRLLSQRKKLEFSGPYKEANWVFNHILFINIHNDSNM